jgi:hypothetical protein
MPPIPKLRHSTRAWCAFQGEANCEAQSRDCPRDRVALSHPTEGPCLAFPDVRALARFSVTEAAQQPPERTKRAL